MAMLNYYVSIRLTQEEIEEENRLDGQGRLDGAEDVFLGGYLSEDENDDPDDPDRLYGTLSLLVNGECWDNWNEWSELSLPIRGRLLESVVVESA